MTTVVISAILKPVSRVSTPHSKAGSGNRIKPRFLKEYRRNEV